MGGGGAQEENGRMGKDRVASGIRGARDEGRGWGVGSDRDREKTRKAIQGRGGKRNEVRVGVTGRETSRRWEDRDRVELEGGGTG